MNTIEYRNGQIKQIKVDGYELAQNETDYYKISVKFWDYENNSTNSLSITNKEFNQIKKILLNKSK
jgi:hypothetical protein